MPLEQRPDRLRDPGGFVLLSVLLVIGIVSALVIALTMTVRADRTNAAIERRLVQASALADAGLTRIIAALEGQDDPLLSNLSKPIYWRFAGQEVVVSLVPEAGKVDLNSGDSDLVVNVLGAVVRDGVVADRLVRRLAAMRRDGQGLETVRGLLDPDDRAGPLARDFEAVFTVWTNLRGVDPKFAPSVVLRNLPGLQAGEAELLVQASARGAYAELSPFITRFGPLLGATRPIYRARAEANVEGATARREVLLAHNPTRRLVWVVFWRDTVE
ncbi:hypothetical protein [Microvirga brassicacearum]|uniref:General secretion pathway protein GspK n=1 Tax=Microvirga brassicacearum TaxID=2580413 RepID=A0A5N3P4L0_9HYPH|nr:hypothetical protein [Microvirga brassicacearum]KAB0264678.1 hypothetical protein FEZ63_21745 [Microvirga brassicacearum]